MGDICILTILNLAIHEHGMSFHLFMSSLMSLSNVFLSFSAYGSFIPVIRLIPELFILFDAVVSGTGFLHFFSRSFIFRVTEMQLTFTCSFHILVLSNLLTSPNRFLVFCFGGVLQNICGFPLVKSLNL